MGNVGLKERSHTFWSHQDLVVMSTYNFGSHPGVMGFVKTLIAETYRKGMEITCAFYLGHHNC